MRNKQNEKTDEIERCRERKGERERERGKETQRERGKETQRERGRENAVVSKNRVDMKGEGEK